MTEANLLKLIRRIYTHEISALSKETENLLFLWGIYSLTSVADYTRNILETDLSLSLSLSGWPGCLKSAIHINLILSTQQP